jgi:hypothetical protein
VKDLKYWNGTAWAVDTGNIRVIVAPNASAAAAAAGPTPTAPCPGGSGVGCGLTDQFMVTQ